MDYEGRAIPLKSLSRAVTGLPIMSLSQDVTARVPKIPKKVKFG